VEHLRSNRWIIAIGGTVVMLTIGCVYSWAIFTQPLLAAYHWDLRTATWAYSIANFSLAAVGAVIGGFWQDKVGPRKVAMVGIALWGCGNVLAGLGTSHWFRASTVFTWPPSTQAASSLPRQRQPPRAADLILQSLARRKASPPRTSAR
jgi:MFS family permease